MTAQMSVTDNADTFRHPALKIDGAAVDFPVAETGRIRATAAADLLRYFRFSGSLPAFFGFLQGA